MLQFHESYRQVDWARLLTQANESLNVVVYYWDKWVQEHEQALFHFLQKPNAKLRFFFSNKLSEVTKLFPNHTEQQLVEKIKKTYEPLQHYLTSKNLPSDKVSVYFLPRLLNYSMQCIDDKILVLSFFEMFRAEQVDGPAMVIDLATSPHLKRFYEKELKGFLQDDEK